MADVRIEQVDERDNNWENHDPRFRVYLHGSSESSTEGWTDTYDIVGADLLQVVDWAQRQAADSLTYAVALVVDVDDEERRNPGHGRGLVWLVGMDGNDLPTTDPDEMDVQQRMLARRRDPVRWPSQASPPNGRPWRSRSLVPRLAP